jgi:hypothetical protein
LVPDAGLRQLATITSLAPSATASRLREPLTAYLTAYFWDAHVKDVAEGCQMADYAGEVRCQMEQLVRSSLMVF